MAVNSLHRPEFKTLEGVHAGMKLKEVEQRLGKLLRIFTAEPAYEQYAAFSKQPRHVSFTRGIFKQGEREIRKKRCQFSPSS
jgi:nucleotidyltransferase/DNA polymerase involved in DNA repair